MNINLSTTMEISRYEIAKLCSESIYFENKTENPYRFSAWEFEDVLHSDYTRNYQDLFMLWLRKSFQQFSHIQVHQV